MANPTIYARFRTQDQAESAVRKLRALRGDCFRIECIGNASASDSLTSMHVEFAAESEIEGEGSQRFTLSANIPEQASNQAKTVINEAGGQLIQSR